MSTDFVARICKGREFQRVGADTEKARTPLEGVVLGTVKRSWFVEDCELAYMVRELL